MVLYFIDMLELALPMSALIAVLLMLSPLIKRSYIAKWRYYMWLFVALRLLIPIRLFTEKIPVVMELPRSISGVPVTVGAVSEAGTAAAVSVQDILMLIWLAGAAVFAIYQVISWLSFKARVRRWAVSAEDEAVTRVYDAACASLALKNRPVIKICKAVSTPMLFGFISPALLLPKTGYTEEELNVILRHELVHYKRHDILYKLIITAANCINWFNPFVYLMAGAANRDIELACDAEVVKDRDMEYRRGYCLTILDVVHNKRQRTAPLSTCFIISRKVIKERFKDILSLKKKRKGILLFAVVALSIAVSGSVVTFATEKAANVLEEELNIIERPTPKPAAAAEPLAQPIEAPAPKAAAVPAPVQQPVITPAPAAAAEPHEEPVITAAPVYVPPRDPETIKAKVNLASQSSEMNISFRGEGETYTSQSSFVAEGDMNMVIVAGSEVDISDGSDDEFNLQIVNDATGEVVHEETVAKNGSLSVPVESGEYSVNATSATEGNSAVSLFVYGN